MIKKFTNHKLLISFAIICLMNLPLHGQIHNALSFDGVDDKVIVPNGSSLIANSTNMSLTVWANPDSNNLPFPDFNGYAGFRNDATADFYLVQIYAGQLEGRLTNSSGISYTVTINGVQAHVWQYFALTYDGAYLRIYANGYIADSIVASGAISSATQAFNVGFLPFGSTPFFTEGLIDEVSLWNKTLTNDEISCIMNDGPSLTDPALKLEFNCNQGTPGGNNSGITTLKDQSNHINGSFTAMPLTGAISNFVQGQSIGQTSFEATLCTGQTYFFNGQTLSTSGTYTAVYNGANGCDSTVVLTLNVNNVNTTVLQNGNLLAASATGVSYQWVDCNNNFSPLSGPGTTSQVYTAPASGSYAVVLTKNGCSDTSSCNTVTVGVNEIINDLNLKIYPNPAKNTLHLSFDKSIETLAVSILSIEGRILSESKWSHQKESVIDLKDFVPGLYLLKIKTNNGSSIKLFEKIE